MAEAHDLVRTLATDFLPNPALPDGEVDRIIQLHTYPVDGGVEANAIRVAIDYCRSASAKFPRGFPEFTTRMLERVGELEAMSFAADANDDKFLLKGLTQAMEVALPLGVGFTPQLGIHIDGERRLLRLRPYIANTGSPPDNVGEFLSEEGGITDDPAAAADLRGPQGEKGDKGDKGDDGQDATVSANVLGVLHEPPRHRHRTRVRPSGRHHLSRRGGEHRHRRHTGERLRRRRGIRADIRAGVWKLSRG